MCSLEQRARARLGEIVLGLELDAVESSDVLSARYTGRGAEGAFSLCILHRRWAELPGMRGAYARAAWLSQTIDHRTLPRVLDSGLTEDQVPFVVLELVGGETLDQYIERRGSTVPPAEALRIGAALGEGLAALAARRAAHGAIQPSAIALRDNGSVRLLHTGWTRLREQAAAHLGCSQLPGLAPYLSPSQARGEPATPADDLWSLAAIVFELLSGIRCTARAHDELAKGALGNDYDVVSHGGAARARGSDPPAGWGESLATRVPGAPPQIVELLDRALCPEPRRRLDDAAEFAARCRHIAQLPAIAGLRRLSRPAALAPALRQTVPERPSVSAPSHSGVSRLDLPEDATATLSSSAAPGPVLHRGAGTYSSRGSDQQRVDTLFPKKP